MFLTCGSSEAMAAVLYLPQLKIHLITNKILVEKIFPSNVLHENSIIDEFVIDVLQAYNNTSSQKALSAKWTDHATASQASIIDSFPDLGPFPSLDPVPDPFPFLCPSPYSGCTDPIPIPLQLSILHPAALELA